LTPEDLGVPTIEEICQQRVRVFVWALSVLREQRYNPVDGQVRDTVRRVVQHLCHDLASAACVVCALDFNKDWYALSVDEQMIKRPSVTAGLLFRNSELSANEEQTSIR
jgi:hypothetical protein